MNWRPLILSRNRQELGRPEPNVFGFLQHEVDRLFEEFARGLGPVSVGGNGRLMPSMEVTETDKELVITAELPGLERKDVDISLEDNVLTIRGEKKSETSPDDKNKNVHVSERSYGVFYRVLELPSGIDPSSVQATMSNGVLKITIPKPARAQPKKIEVKEAA
jgi:HSP20 family protein